MIKKREYNKALKVVKEYEEQLLNKSITASTFGFLWWNENDIQYHRWIKAKDIDSACRKFIRNQPKTIRKLDYEVQNGKNYIDISERKEFKHLL